MQMYRENRRGKETGKKTIGTCTSPMYRHTVIGKSYLVRVHNPETDTQEEIGFSSVFGTKYLHQLYWLVEHGQGMYNLKNFVIRKTIIVQCGKKQLSIYAAPSVIHSVI